MLYEADVEHSTVADAVSKFALTRHHRSRRAGAAIVSIHVREPGQLFNSLDPSPSWDRDLDRAAAEFIEDEFSEKLSAEAWHLHVYAQEGSASPADLQAAVEHYYERLANSARRGLREHLWIGQLALGAGLIMFMLCMAAREILTSFSGEAPRVVDQGLIILAWLALGRPAEMLGYEWIPLYRRRRLYERLANIRVSVRGAAARSGESRGSDLPVHAATTRSNGGGSDVHAHLVS
jgi:hypothetical protein